MLAAAPPSAETGEPERAAARGRAYLFFAQALEYPDDALSAFIASGQLARELRDVLAGVDAALLASRDETKLAHPPGTPSSDDLQVEYTRLFDTAASKDACHLYESGYVASKDRALEESLRFYDYFGLVLAEEAREMPDYLGTQLEFLHYLAYSQAVAIAEDRDPAPFRRAERDFLERHPGKWVPKLAEQMQRKQPMVCFGEIIASLHDLLEVCAHQLDVDDGVGE